ncbi:DNA polymerase III subunit delta [Thermithiobacillus plumbiphilus]|uniref:DNA polymerase III subunit delta n=1 Tax=Thermithiobacillus plumbiphilus TaxID=1729899 RepID=A0ABU9D7J2_9PROT
MRLKPEQLTQHLKGKLAPLYAFFSDEPFFLIEAEQQLRATASRAGFDQTETWTVEPSFDWGQLQDARQSLSLFAERRLLLLRMGAQKPGDAGSRALQAWAAEPPADVLLLVSGERPDASAQKSAWFKALETAGTLVLFYPPEASEWPQWVRARLREKGLDLSPAGQTWLIERSEGNPLACMQAINQLSLLAQEGRISEDDVLAVVGDNARFSVFDLSEAALAGKAHQALRILAHLEQEGVEPILVLWALARDLRVIIALQDRNTNPGQLWREHKVFGKQQELLLRAARKLPSDSLVADLKLCARLDASIKGQDHLPVWPSLGKLAMQLAGITGNSARR